MNIHTSFEAKTRANMKAIRARLMGKPVKPAPKPVITQSLEDKGYRAKDFAFERKIYELCSTFADPAARDYDPQKYRDNVLEYVKERCGVIGVSYDDVMKMGRERYIAGIRSYIYYEVRKSTNLSYEKMGHLFGRDPTVIEDCIARVAQRVETPTPFYPWEDMYEKRRHIFMQNFKRLYESCNVTELSEILQISCPAINRIINKMV